MTRRLRLAAALVALALAASACDSGQAAGDGETDLPDLGLGTEPTSDIDYVALGDSFSAGPFIGTMRTDPQGCARSKDNYPAFLADWLEVASYTDVTCSAATTADLYEPMLTFDGQTTPPQLDAVSADTDLVTLGMGGNDFGIYEALIQCQAGTGAACPVERLRADAARVAGRIQQAVRRITRAAPDAEVLVVGYPDILPSDGSCPAVGVPADVLRPVAEVAGVLNDSLRRGALAAGASYVDMAAVSDGHDVCAKGRAWVNGPQFRAGIAAPFHPKVNGMRAVATEVFREVTGEDPEVTEHAEPDPDVVVVNEG
ncbi:SGNH/GDSL hydrolase family protein [Nocardioides sp. zg-1228]|uniref:SGNH/GDSL hydrolase family protein n=1 Tax=Nocardioides sp. zg-1228 TaxID=2763008 RepID=UPI001642E510|nr:SGNH/GDSL hydrolase family protein [Nocardioides sp. zg-1228]MBC2933787.1 SGNH/GDSL hydrolase family protein [Nocardioides sp. zg-1228]QSF58563.1 SGNH/GDSL hydrolase family protein [Nocardioides sp. zg-1228]